VRGATDGAKMLWRSTTFAVILQFHALQAMMIADFKAGGAPCGETTMIDTKHGGSLRRFSFFQPCGSGSMPLVFALHCFGCGMDVMDYWQPIASEFQFALVIPEGLESSFNAGPCCGFAKQNNIDDVGFLASIIQTVTSLGLSSREVSSEAVFAFGWSNGGYLATVAAPLFHAIAPVSGYVEKVVAACVHHDTLTR
jgi:poly(3-hydroxybutyrate) depolymerase